MSVKVIAFDMDNTLLDSNKMILESSKVAIKRALDMGIKIVMCTGRPLAGVSEYMDELGIHGDDQYVITYNGAIVETAAGKTLNKYLINKDEYVQLVKYGDEHDIQYYALDDNSNVYTGNRDVSRVAVIQANENHAGIYVRTPDELPEDFAAAKFDFVGEIEKLDNTELQVIRDFDEQFNVVREGTVFLAVMNRSASKGFGLRRLAEYLNLTADQVMAFGDEKNDISMFKYAGTAVCMENGSDIAKNFADYITDTHDNDGIAKAMDKFVF
ncbi:Cof-type HAD-IIB family hydrolase [Companilactobacillus nodensis]|uniref:HAD superfamily hydrolase n=1 Tax=Companilactobacillus nodensis DSM 19682 = JCM 14932 = NBRC 107160 TaxID=1423775 RepID=A0A0R1K5X4_9LACO|nr:Cof-type HAD-IIB family hydrolase [Companilactobacillus nodensis]KRK78667.1 HAD superfamily hydrolase [Companilactobacillus nodensis DSM 19682 = JCM 14932 = NBRC 107160]